ncbi:MAG: hypothetical protein KGH79_01890 [Patescibacteria group bacterium]|nr:hypothetical protein [Patescibacteria group bacterium]
MQAIANAAAQSSDVAGDSKWKQVFSKVPEVTLFFWIIKVLCTTVGETAADFLNVNLNFGLTITSVIMGILFIASLIWQFKTKKYTPLVYWLTVALISVFGTLVTDNLSDNLHVPLEYSTVLFTILLAITFAVWYAKEKTLSIHSIFTPRREAFYWLAILFTFALGTASGDLMAEALGLGYLVTGLIVTGTIAAFAIAWRIGLNSVIAFWFIYIMTRPLGASLGDLLSQSREHGGLGLGPTNTSIIFVAGIILTVAFLAFTHKDVMRDPIAEEREDDRESKREFWQLPVVIVLLLSLSIGGYYYRHQQLQSAAASAAKASASAGIQAGPLGDLSSFKTIAQAILTSVQASDWAGANSHVNDLEYAWDNSQAQLKPMNGTAWTHIDGALDKVFREVRAVSPNQESAESALQSLLAILDRP